MTKIVDNALDAAISANIKANLAEIAEWWGFDTSAYVTWGNLRADLNKILMNGIVDGEYAQNFFPKFEILNEPSVAILETNFSSSEVGVYYDISDPLTIFSDVAGLTNADYGDAVAMIKDKSGNDIHAIQSVALNRPIYARHPSVGVRNILNKASEDYTVSDWIKLQCTVTPNAISSVSGYLDATKVVFDNGSTSGFVSSDNVSLNAGTYAFSVYAKAGEFETLSLVTDLTGIYRAVRFDLIAGTVSTGTDWLGTIEDVGNGWFRCTGYGATLSSGVFDFRISINTTGLVGDGASGFYIHGAQLESGSTATNYQKIISEYDITESGINDSNYLKFSANTFLETANTDFSSADQLSLYCSFSTANNATTGTIVEFGTDIDSNNGSFAIMSPAADGETNVAVSTKGTIKKTISSNILLNEKFNVTAQADISADTFSSKVNYVDSELIEDLGAGNYGNYPIYIGMRAGTTLPYNGNLYFMLIKNSLAGTKDLYSTEMFIENAIYVSQIEIPYSAQYWRFVATTVWRDVYTPIAEIEWLDASNNVLAGGGVAPGSEIGSTDSVYAAYDLDQTNAWYGEMGYTTVTNLEEQPWVGYNFGSGASVNTLRLQTSDWGDAFFVTSGLIQSSQDGITWKMEGVVPLRQISTAYSWHNYPIGNLSEPFVCGTWWGGSYDTSGDHVINPHDVIIGDPSPNRVIAVAIAYQHFGGTGITDGRATSVIIGGIPATRVADSGDITDTYGIDVWVAQPSGYTASLEITFPRYSDYILMGTNIFCISDAASTTPNIVNSSPRSDVDGGGLPNTFSTVIPDNTGVIAISQPFWSFSPMTGIEHSSGAFGEIQRGVVMLGTEDVVTSKTITLSTASPTTDDAGPRVLVGWAHT